METEVKVTQVDRLFESFVRRNANMAQAMDIGKRLRVVPDEFIDYIYSYVGDYSVEIEVHLTEDADYREVCKLLKLGKWEKQFNKTSGTASLKHYFDEEKYIGLSIRLPAHKTFEGCKLEEVEVPYEAIPARPAGTIKQFKMVCGAAFEQPTEV